MDIRSLQGIESGITRRRIAARLKEIAAGGLGQHYPKPCPQQPAATDSMARLGPPLDIRQVAILVGSSPWSIRNKWIPRGLPHFRLGASSKLIFYTNQVVAWIERQQQGGNKR